MEKRVTTVTGALGVAVPMPRAATFSHLYVHLRTAMALVGSTMTITVYDATTSTTLLTCAPVFTGILAIGTECSSSGSASAAAGDYVAYAVNMTGLTTIVPVADMTLSVEAN